MEPGTRLLIAGASGGGKSSLLRAFSGLWNSGKGSITRPPLSDILFLPQRPYMIVGSLRDQLLYPNNNDELTDQDLAEALLKVRLPKLIDRVGGLDTTCDWSKTLSLGEQQRVAIARVFLANQKVCGARRSHQCAGRRERARDLPAAGRSRCHTRQHQPPSQRRQVPHDYFAARRRRRLGVALADASI